MKDPILESELPLRRHVPPKPAPHGSDTALLKDVFLLSLSKSLAGSQDGSIAAKLVHDQELDLGERSHLWAEGRLVAESLSAAHKAAIDKLEVR